MYCRCTTLISTISSLIVYFRIAEWVYLDGHETFLPKAKLLNMIELVGKATFSRKWKAAAKDAIEKGDRIPGLFDWWHLNGKKHNFGTCDLERVDLALPEILLDNGWAEGASYIKTLALEAEKCIGSFQYLGVDIRTPKKYDSKTIGTLNSFGIVNVEAPYMMMGCFLGNAIRTFDNEPGKFVYWPMTQPDVNNRKIDCGDLQDMLRRLEAGEENWGVQMGVSVPYALVGSDIEDASVVKDERVELGTMMHDTRMISDNRLDMEEKCAGVGFGAVEKLYKALTVSPQEYLNIFRVCYCDLN